MPEIGDIKKAKEIWDFKSNHAGGNRYIYLPCTTCGKLRWVSCDKSQHHDRCKVCTSKENLGHIRNKHPSWKGGKFLDGDGYVLVRLYEDNFYFPMANCSGYIREHRLAMAKHLGRLLQKWEVVHHRGTKYAQGSKENRSDNRLENLELGTQHNHMIEHDRGYKDGFKQGSLAGKSQALRELNG